ncbi:type II CRISPR-associated endonuclease Cas1 [Companilactobacillus mishanensis]|uniref:Type II CRISPR-associated endonuclease Cas1 n=1 Tax=Companilactobacillus mishanensis TaxID=2486008 RepID=A0ABW9P7D1_9LACO|nr:type II CRISPR-associated endonuclease Cas1 [Companilactobacillus mishanensis]MQS45068.1 type II CRISPR-associated endonuclease Cas1 [Companilactobacillus mishanensis]
MGWRTVYIASKSKLSYKSNHLLIQTNTETKQMSLNQIDSVVISTTQAVITGYLVAKLVEKDIKVIFCSENHNPCAELCGYNSNNNRNKNIDMQISWSLPSKENLWMDIVTNKMRNQIDLLKLNNSKTEDLEEELSSVVENDQSNREAVIARKYFQRLFGEDYTRGTESNITAMLNYGYTILLSTVNQEIVAQGYLTQLGIHHHSLINDFNLSSDLMEPFRQFIDLKVIEKKDFEFNEYTKFELIDVLNKEIKYAGKTYHLRNAITKHVHDCLEFLNGERDSIHSVVMPNEV